MNFKHTDKEGNTTDGNLESWFLNQLSDKFPSNEDYVSIYRALKTKLKPIHKQVTQGADFTDKTSLTWHDESHIQTVIAKASDLLSYNSAEITPFEAFILICAIQLHDIMNSVGREGHEEHATDILDILEITGLFDSLIKRAISDIISCHSGSFLRGTSKERDKIGFTLSPIYPLKGEDIKMQFLAATLRLADEYADNEYRAMSYLLKIERINEESEIHQKYSECLHSIRIKKNSGIIDLDFHISQGDALRFFKKVNREKETVENVYLIDEIFTRLMKTYYETIYCMRYMRQYIPIEKLSIFIEVLVPDRQNPLKVNIELVEKGYPGESYSILDICGQELRLNGAHWSGYNIMHYIKNNYSK